jgi:hypothetical protein
LFGIKESRIYLSIYNGEGGKKIMAFTWAVLLVVLGIVLVIAGQGFVRKAKARKMLTWLGVIGVGLFLLSYAGIAQLAFLNGQVNLGGTQLAVTTTTTNAGSMAGYQPTATYSTVDKFTGNGVSGTSYMKTGSSIATSGTIASVNEGTKYTYWVSNATEYVQPNEFVATTGANTVINSNAYANSSASITIFDVLGNQNVQNGVANTSMGAGDSISLDLKYKGTFQGSAMPFGGVLVVETNQSITSVNCNGDDISTSVPFSKVSYTVQAVADTYVTFGVAGTIDDGSGSTKVVHCTFKNGATDTSSPVYWKFIPANWYRTQAGDLALDVQKNADSSTTRVGLGSVSATTYFT